MDAKKKLLSTAANLIHSKGFNDTSVQDILDETAVARSNFYYHFDSKEQLGFEVFARLMRLWYGFVIEPSLDNRNLTPAERADKMLDSVLMIGTSPEGELGCPFGNLAQEMSYIHEPFRQALSEFFGSVATRLQECFEEGKRTGDFDQNLPSRQLAEFAIAQIQGSFLLRKAHKDPEVMRSNIQMLRQIVQEKARPAA